MKKQGLFLMLLIVQYYAFCQNTTLKPKVTDQGYCYDSAQIREVARLVVQEPIKDEIITRQDSSITNLKSQVITLDTVIKAKDSILVNKSKIIELNKANIRDLKTVHESEKAIQKIKHKRQKKHLFIAILVESVVLVLLILSK